MLGSSPFNQIDGATATYPNGSTTATFFSPGDRSTGAIIFGVCGNWSNNASIRYGINPSSSPVGNGTYVFTI